MRVYGFQITPGSDETLAYCKDREAAFREAREHRRGILEGGEEPRLDATALYEVWLADISAEALIAVLNDPDELEARFVRGKTLIGFVTEN